MKKILLIGAVPVLGGKEPAYYVDQTSGNDGNGGLSPDDAWKTIAKINGASFLPGDRILFKRGELWRETMNFPSSGSAGHKITIGAYGTGAKPLITSAKLITPWNSEGANIYNCNGVIWAEPAAMYFDDVIGTKRAAKVDLANPNDWFWAANIMYVYSTTDPTGKVVEASHRYFCIDQNGKSYLRFENIACEKSRISDIRIDGDATNIELYGVDSDMAYQNGVGIGVSGGGAVTPSNVTIDNCTITLPNRESSVYSANIFQFEGTSGGDNLTIKNCVLSNDIVADNSGNSEDGIIIEDGDDILIEANTISAVDHGIHMRGSGVGGFQVETFTIRYNLIDSCDDAIWLNGTSEADSEIYYNVINSTGDQYFDIIGEGGKIYNNTCYGGRNNAIALQTLAATKVIFKNNIISHHANDRVIIYIDDVNSVDISNSTFDNNLYYRAAPSADFWEYSGGGGDDFADWQSTHSQDANGLNEDPVFTTPGTDFTLQAGSNCRDAGVDVSLIIDIAGVSVPQETNPTMGAYEYTG